MSTSQSSGMPMRAGVTEDRVRLAFSMAWTTGSDRSVSPWPETVYTLALVFPVT